MDYIWQGLRDSLRIIGSLEPEFLGTVAISLKVSFISTALATVLGVPFGMWIAEKRSPGARAIITILNTLMSLPTVVVGLMVYSFLSRRGPLGEWGLLYTQTAMVIGQFILAFPIVAGLSVSAVAGLDKRIRTTAVSLGADTTQSFRMYLREARYGVMAAVVAGFGRVFAEVGVSMMLGGNIRGYTRNITTAMALETSKGEFAFGIALGVVLLTVALAVNILFGLFRERSR
ncbi:MAG: ABC transporter permease [Kiritimatiellia bacterium]|jgi:tungstate transport system permease protein|nr:ABC transporter permease [Kiritimatiellia bacterium]MDP6630442.1 ABC transporter permease [Kiritimatiellia bacterium]MDP6809899.1 ABC transporter permease [Kiritimatiellia bacterium]MDP7024291.1 ABC transporter permease [Kiritimatiellia bacterium]